VHSKRRLPGSGRNALERDGQRRLTGVKRIEILDELPTRHVPAVVVGQEIERRRGVRLALEENTQVLVTKMAEDEARQGTQS
jgi:hypothetical protein